MSSAQPVVVPDLHDYGDGRRREDRHQRPIADHVPEPDRAEPTRHAGDDAEQFGPGRHLRWAEQPWQPRLGVGSAEQHRRPRGERRGDQQGGDALSHT